MALRCAVKRTIDIKRKGDYLDEGTQWGREGAERAGEKILYRNKTWTFCQYFFGDI